MENKKQQRQMRYTDKELQLIKSTFAENDELLKIIRKVMLQIPLDSVDLSRLELVKKPEVLAVLRKTFLPTIDPDAPLNQVIDLWMTIQIADKTPDEALPHFKARKKLIEYLDQQLRFLEEDRDITIKFSELINLDRLKKETPDVYSNIVARNTIISHTEMQLGMLKILGGLKDETLEETQERLRKDSTK